MGQVTVPLGVNSHIRRRAEEPAWIVHNCFFEQNPANQVEQVALLERPALIELLDSGDGPSRRVFTQKGFADGALFHISGIDLYKHKMETTRTITTTTISGFVAPEGIPDMAATDTYLWIADGSDLQYTDGTAALTPITTPDDIPMISLDIFNSFVLCVQNDSDRFYWILPGEVTIDPLDFATAERQPDHVLQVRSVGDEFWLLGERTIEVWRATGDDQAPFVRLEGRRFEHGIFGGTAVRMSDTSVVLIAHDGTVVDVAGASTPISNPSIAERTRNAIFTAIEHGED